MKKTFLVVLICFYYSLIQAQDKWDLKRCVDYAVANNISVKQADVNARLAELTYKQTILAQIPTLGFNGSLSYNAGYTQNPQTFALVTSGLFYNTYSLQSSVNFFNFNSLKYTSQASHFSYLAANANTEYLKNNIMLNVANAYLQFLLLNETEKASALQLSLSQAQLENTRKQVLAGALPELNAAELESQVAQDSATYIASKANTFQQALTVKAYLSLDAATPFELDTPPIDKIPVDNISELQPQDVYALALKNQPLQKYDELVLKSNNKLVDAYKAARLPTFSLFGGLSSTYTNLSQEVSGFTTVSAQPVGSVNVGGTPYTVYSLPYSEPTFKNQPFGSQLNQAFRQSIGLQVSVPILNGGVLKTNYLKSKLSVRNSELQLQADNLALKQNIYLAYNAALSAFEKYKSNIVTVAATQRSFEYAQKRYDVGLLNTIDLLTNQNNYFKAKIDLISSQFDYVFKMKVLEFYKGMGIKL